MKSLKEWMLVSVFAGMLFSSCQGTCALLPTACGAVLTAASSAADEETSGKNAGGGNTAGGIGTARVKEKTTTEKFVPEEARKLTEAIMNKIPPILRGLRESGRLNWKMSELEDDVLILKWKQERMALSCT